MGFDPQFPQNWLKISKEDILQQKVCSYFLKMPKKKYETTEIKLVNREIKKVKNKKRTKRKSETARCGKIEKSAQCEKQFYLLRIGRN